MFLSCLNKLNRKSSRGRGISVRFVFHFQPPSLNAFHECKEWWCPKDGEDTQRRGIDLWALWEWMPSLRKTHFGWSCEQEINVYCVKGTELWQVCAVWVSFRTHSTETFTLAFPSIVALTSWVSHYKDSAGGHLRIQWYFVKITIGPLVPLALGMVFILQHDARNLIPSGRINFVGNWN